MKENIYQIETEKEKLMKQVNQYIARLEANLLKDQQDLDEKQEIKRNVERSTHGGVIWDKEVSNFIDREESEIETLRQEISFGKALLNRHDTTVEKLQEYLKI